ncbi:hypothetical protein TVAG_289360 [Trichomonas vaginalis G3]|uniref:Uncharacterized protein n=1 Tax=Trichomonas vaginalis (strain ATCC PRA-98 / G3) TaxID=412133 RepID=A2G3Q7_TRIV3|nr:hypothetical protein TVAGG3_0623670 [Trichomonas vaginalis G3]EAX88205.1 hypothetical protein TVAG_289360 [Trichomonas vaginalis G3]KAI5504041.1 hypothetical protein TVAGG3_0623670 [Trichomonas vaginalis G3]|eukprot:XP_001301135.1 hypothetical protein [Trichomonas vaginalis G3]
MFLTATELYFKVNDLSGNVKLELFDNIQYNKVALILAHIVKFLRKFIPNQNVSVNEYFNKNSKFDIPRTQDNSNSNIKEVKTKEENDKETQSEKEKLELEAETRKKEEEKRRVEEERIRKEKEEQRKKLEEQKRIQEQNLQNQYDQQLLDKINRISERFERISNENFGFKDYSYRVPYTITCYPGEKGLDKFNSYRKHISTPQEDSKWCVPSKYPTCQININKPSHIRELYFPNIQDVPEIAKQIEISNKKYNVNHGSNVRIPINQETGSLFNMTLIGPDKACIPKFEIIGNYS